MYYVSKRYIRGILGAGFCPSRVGGSNELATFVSFSLPASGHTSYHVFRRGRHGACVLQVGETRKNNSSFQRKTDPMSDLRSDFCLP